MGWQRAPDTARVTSSTVHVYLSPHLDDAALSCGGTIWKQVQAGQRVVVVNVFAGVPDYARLPAFAREKHAVWGSPDDVVAARRAEDQAALALLGADVVYWEYLDCIYRLDGARALYPGEAYLWGDVDPADSALCKQIVADIENVLSEAGEATCYAPLGIGHHVDHQIVRDVGLALVRRGRRVWFYEDFPYAWRHYQNATDRDDPLPHDWEVETQPIEIEPKIAAIACYRSQVPDLFGSEAAMAEAVREYARAVGRTQYAERFWHPVTAT